MPVKETKITKKTISKPSKLSVKESGIELSEQKKVAKKTVEKKGSTKKVVVKRRKVDLAPSKASAVAIASQANRAKKQALLEKMMASDNYQSKNEDVVNNDNKTKIPLWVWIFFGFSLLLFCVSFYWTRIRPQLETEVINIPTNEDIYRSVDEDGNIVWEVSLAGLNSAGTPSEALANNEIIETPQDAAQLIQSFFGYMSNGEFDKSFDLFDTRAQRDANIKQYFGESKMSPFFQWIEWKSIIPQNIQKTSDTYKWKDVYTFDISYSLASTHEQYDETWEFVAGDADWEWKIFRIYCITSQCSKHPIFRPEKFGLMK